MHCLETGFLPFSLLLGPIQLTSRTLRFIYISSPFFFNPFFNPRFSKINPRVDFKSKLENEAKHCLEHCFIPLSVLLGPIQLISRTQNAQVYFSVSVRVQYN